MKRFRKHRWKYLNKTCISNKRILAWSVREVMLWRRLSGGYWSLWRAAILQGDRPSRRNSCALTLHNELSKTADQLISTTYKNINKTGDCWRLSWQRLQTAGLRLWDNVGFRFKVPQGSERQDGANLFWYLLLFVVCGFGSTVCWNVLSK